MRSWAALGGGLGFSHTAAFLQRRRTATQTPTEDEVRSAYAALGVATSSPFQEVKKRYIELAKQHHPDVSGGSANDASQRMVNINNAYATLNMFHKAGGVLPGGSRPSSSSSSNNSSYGHAYYTTNDEPYHPWHEDLNPLVYEMMWDEMRRQAENEAFAQAAAHENKRRHNYQQGTEAPRGGQKKTYGDNRRHPKSGGKPRKTTTWPDADLQAMVNMYQDGKSFDFIANALGKQASDVIAEFNRWNDDKKRSSRPSQRRPRGYYYAESPDFDFPDFGDDVDDDPYGYGCSDEGEHVDPEDVFFDGGAIPFRGGHYMSGQRPRYGHNGNRGGGGGGGGGGASAAARGRHGSNRRQW
ncbi:hypothetical protein DQ04_02081030 [Trypanosoma grayi]|uniref:hypothetical protein n=1 Tax=Trypanosoma grayi TaxID=71804 RepID=UPI0004F4683D|nr:hypothetical protein DQ04_02081030 [Trypanosoma grayi]KEG12000.1 hypothetical protein DQ04_02081030 [Trypanosoma grayi]